MAQRKSTARTKSKAVQKLRYGWVPDVPDQRDLLYSAVRPAPLALPQHIDLRLNVRLWKTRVILEAVRAMLLPVQSNFSNERMSFPS